MLGALKWINKNMVWGRRLTPCAVAKLNKQTNEPLNKKANDCQGDSSYQGSAEAIHSEPFDKIPREHKDEGCDDQIDEGC